MKKCQYNINPKTFPVIECNKKAIWKVEFSSVSCDEPEEYGKIFHNYFCEDHFNYKIKSCSNIRKYKKIKKKR